jgi:apolipoprotein N-acyltransferase
MLGLGFVTSFTWFLGLLGIWLFFEAVAKDGNKKLLWWGGVLAFFIKNLLVLSWGWSIYPLDWFSVPLTLNGFWGISFYWIMGAGFLSLGGGFLALAISYFKRVHTVWFIVLTPIVWLLFEVLNALFFSIATLGGGGYISSSYSYGFVGYLLAEHNLLLLMANWGGVYILTIVAVLLVVVVRYFEKIKPSLAIAVVGAVTLSMLMPLPRHEDNKLDYKVALLETDFDAEFTSASNSNEEQKKRIIAALDAAILGEADYVILPEDAHYTNLNLTKEGANSWYRFQNKDTNTILVDSGQATLGTGDSIMRATVYDGVEKSVWQFDKQYLVPQGEYTPNFFLLLLKLFRQTDLVDAFKATASYVPGPIVGQGDLPEHLPRVLFCFSSADPTAVKNLVNDTKVPFVAHITSHAWFNDSEILRHQQAAMLKVQSVWSGVPIVQSANMGLSQVYLPNGYSYHPTVVAEGDRFRILRTDI